MAATTIKLPAKLDRELTALAKERHTTRAKVLREALHAFAQRNGKVGNKTKQTVGALAADLIGSVTDAPAPSRQIPITWPTSGGDTDSPRCGAARCPA